MENREHINQLLENFWAGTSSLEEEQALRKAVFETGASEELKALRSLFLGPIERAELPSSADQKFNQAFVQIQVQDLLKKYWAGESSLEEEATLKKLVHQLPEAISESDEFKSELAVAKMIFVESPEAKISEAGEAKMLAFFDEIKGQEAKVVPLKEAKVKSLPKRNWMKIAVVGLLLIGIGSVWTKRVNDMEKAEAQLAYQQTKEAFELLGMHFNKGEQTTINSIRNASKNLDILN